MPNHKKVISFPEPKHWSFFDYVDGGGNRIKEWYSGLSLEAKDRFDALLKNTRKITNHLQWGGFKFLKGKPKEERIWQLDFIADGKQYRLLGVFGGVRKKAVILLGCFHKGVIYTPQNALETVCRRAKELREGRATSHEREVQDDI